MDPGLSIETNGGNLALGAICLLVLMSFSIGRARGVSVIFGLCVGFVVSIVAVNAISASIDYERTAKQGRKLKYVVEAMDRSRPQLMLVGSSQTMAGVDPALLEQLVNAGGRNLQVLTLSGPGLTIYAADYYLDRYFERAGKVPEWVFIELGADFFNNPAYVHPDRVLQAETIVDLAPPQAFWRLRQAFEDGSLAWPNKLSQALAIASHALYRLTNYGLRAQAMWFGDVGKDAGFAPLAEDDPRRTILAPDFVARNLAVQPGPEHVPPTPVNARWREWQARKLFGRGVKVVGFYQGTHVLPQPRAWVRRVCDSLPKGIRCIAGDDAELQRLGASDWFDVHHLTMSGVPVYTAWLARRILEAASAN
jgi:hypothetical protein